MKGNTLMKFDVARNTQNAVELADADLQTVYGGQSGDAGDHLANGDYLNSSQGGLLDVVLQSLGISALNNNNAGINGNPNSDISNTRGESGD
jgi:hypothetical protein